MMQGQSKPIQHAERGCEGCGEEDFCKETWFQWGQLRLLNGQITFEGGVQ